MGRRHGGPSLLLECALAGGDPTRHRVARWRRQTARGHNGRSVLPFASGERGFGHASPSQNRRSRRSEPHHGCLWV